MGKDVPVSFVGVISEELGGFFSDFKALKQFMQDKAINEPREVSALALYDSKANRLIYYVQPWKNNSEGISINRNPQFTYDMVRFQSHTHPSSLGGSLLDATYSANWQIPVYTVGKNGNMWKVDYRENGYYDVPIDILPPWLYYGTQIIFP